MGDADVPLPVGIVVNRPSVDVPLRVAARRTAVPSVHG
jgi:hypothetical protein